MAEKPEMTLREYLMPSEIESCIVLPPVDEDVSFEIDPSWISFIQTSYQFGGLPSEDPNMHIHDFLLICPFVKCDGLCEDGLRLLLFPFSLKDNASRWFRSLPGRSITTWDQLVTKFLARYCPPSRLKKMKIDIVEFAQFESESLYEAKERFQDLLRRCPDHNIPDWFLSQVFFQGLTPANRSLLDVSLGSYLRKHKPTQAYDLLDEMNYTDFQWQLNRPVMEKLEKLPDVSATHTNTITEVDLGPDKFGRKPNDIAPKTLPSLHMNELCTQVDYLSTDCQKGNFYGLQSKEFKHEHRCWY